MRFLVVSESGQGLGIASHLSSEGHSVTFTTLSESPLGRGIVDRSNETAPDIVLFDSDKFSSQAQQLREQGLRVLGASQWAGALNSNSDYAQSIIKSVGWPTEGVTKGVHLYVTGWFNGTRFIATYASLVYRRLMSSGNGPDIRFTGVVGNFWLSRHSRTTKNILEPLERILKRANHRGAFHTHVFVNEDDYCVPEVWASTTDPLAVLLFENSRNTISDTLLKLFDENSNPISPTSPWTCGVLLSVPPYPYEAVSSARSLRGVNPGNLKHLWLIDACKDGSAWSSGGVHGKLGYVTARGNSVNESVRRVYRTISNLSVPDLQYRDDIGRDTYRLFQQLRSWGWLT